MWQKEQGEAEELFMDQVLDCQPVLATGTCSYLLSTVRSVAVCQHTLLCTWTRFWAALSASKPDCLSTRIKCSPSDTCALGWHGRGCQLAGQPLPVTGGTLSVNHAGHPYSVHLAPCPPHLEQPVSSISKHLVQLLLALC